MFSGSIFLDVPLLELSNYLLYMTNEIGSCTGKSIDYNLNLCCSGEIIINYNYTVTLTYVIHVGLPDRHDVNHFRSQAFVSEESLPNLSLSCFSMLFLDHRVAGSSTSP